MSYISEVNINGASHKIGSTLYGTCDTAANDPVKAIDLPDFTKFVRGVTIRVKFTNSNTAADPTLNVNNMGALPIYRYGSVKPGNIVETSWNPGAVISFTFDGMDWIMSDWMNSPTIVYSETEPENAFEGMIWLSPKTPRAEE